MADATERLNDRGREPLGLAAVGGRDDTRGLVFGLLGVLAFSFTLPATRIAAPALGGVVVGLGRAEIAALLAAVLLLIRRELPPPRRCWPGLAIVAGGVVVGFPLLTSFALRQVPAAHGAVVVGLLPAATAIMAVVRAGERPSPSFWGASAAGVGAVLVFAAAQGAGTPQPADLLLLAAVALAGLGYAEGGRLARELGGWRVICWALVLAAPFLLPPAAIAVARGGVAGDGRAWAAFAYVSVVSMFLGFFAWYRGLALGGIARVGQVQLIQPVLTLAWAVLLLGETVDLPTLMAALLVVATVALGRRARA
ncbi:MAG: Permease of the drug/metabolite transporter (DMT) superfamily [uncultured Thermomicrobiales bacterium]|uniref:Permease of the drug/metabolite transporter (DMT) superfamily n=1 Tax=uncultured Thermomicrobiales bacterium TaxID=1645740 RepID=A0A6J4ULT5_9BACT|nr:MAG: Permease of the drug/metabolite transporter (DMT) superfamily [uncultured Thermomicrobiales bacterium]